MRVLSTVDEMIVAGKLLETLWIEASRPELPAIVMLHEGLGSIALWKKFPYEVARRTGCGVLVYSRYGHGASERLNQKRPVDVMNYEGEVVLPELLANLAIERPIFLGHSDGGSIALLFAAKFPDRVHALILEAPHLFVEDLSITSITQARLDFLAPTEFRRKLARYHNHVDETFWGWNDLWLDPAFRSWNIEERLSSIHCPVLCLQGEQDQYGTIAQLEALKLRIPQAEIILLEDCRHSPHRDQTERTLQAIVKFVAEIVREPK